MSDKSPIEWTDATWNPVRGCSRVSKGCENCYAERQAIRFAGPSGAYRDLVKKTSQGPKWTGKIRHVYELLDAPLRWRKSRRIFVNSMGDLFHPDVSPAFIADVFAHMAYARQHIFQVLTKRPERMHAVLTDSDWSDEVYDMSTALAHEAACEILGRRRDDIHAFDPSLPLANVWLGVSIEDQATADERIPLLLQTPAAVRFISAEPLLGPVLLRKEISSKDGSTPCAPESWSVTDWLTGWIGTLDHHRRGAGQSGPKIDQVITGGESGPKARPSHPDWFRSLRDQCAAAGVPFFFKQWGEWSSEYDFAAKHIQLHRNGETKGGLFPDNREGWSQRNRVGKKASGRLLDGREHSEFPS